MFLKLNKNHLIKTNFKIDLLKVFLGILFGISLSATAYSYAQSSSKIQALISQTRVIFHFNNATVEMDDSENRILYYNDKAYIPLRQFSENIGATVSYQAPSQKNNNKSLIEIYK